MQLEELDEAYQRGSAVEAFNNPNERVFVHRVSPKMHQCAGGPGPNVFDTLTPLEKWVESGIAPNRVIATHFVGNDPANTPDRTMPLCMFSEESAL